MILKLNAEAKNRGLRSRTAIGLLSDETSLIVDPGLILDSGLRRNDRRGIRGSSRNTAV